MVRVSYAPWAVRILFACRVSFLSVFAGVFLFLMSTQARDLFADVTYGALPGSPEAWGHWLWFFALLILVWAFPAHYAGRQLLYRDEWMFSCRIRREINPTIAAAVKDEIEGFIDWIPRLLAIVPFAAVLIGLWKAHKVVAETMALAPAQRAAGQIWTLFWLDLFFGAAFFAFLVWRRFATRKMTMWRLNVFAWLYMAIVTALFLASATRPFFPADIAPRAAIVPLMFGSFVFVATFLAWIGHKFCFPVLTLSVVAALVVTAFNTRFNDMRTLGRSAADYSLRQVGIEAAAEAWKAANCGAGACPPALIVSAEGGASRAAFAAATAVGELLDRAGKFPDAQGREIAPARRIFAISGVSGGAFGAATIRTALADSLGRGQSGPPCLRPPNEWFAPLAGDVKTSWRACLQALVSGDYLTPAFVGLAFRDNFSPPNPFSGGSPLVPDDRAALVERAFERHYDHIVRGEIPSFSGQVLEDLAASGQEMESGLRSRFGFVAEKLSPPGAWLPLLLLNGTSVNTGARIIASDLISTRAAPESPGHPAGRVSLYSAAFDLLEMLSNPCPVDKVQGRSCATAHEGAADEPGARSGPDIRLSTAAMLSARFPIISPAGIIRAQGAMSTGDRVVDGGYFENAGLTTAMDVARELMRLGIVPVVLWVRNNPSAEAGDPHTVAEPFPPRAAGTPDLGPANPPGLESVFGVVATPVDALEKTRDGHAIDAANAAQEALEGAAERANATAGPAAPNAVTSSYFSFGMFEYPRFGKDAPAGSECAALAEASRPGSPHLSEVSMSWWLSQSVQSELNAQVCDERNRASLDQLMNRLSQSFDVEAVRKALSGS